MSDYTPTTDDMRTSWHRNSMSYGPGERAAEFDRFIAKVKADALREAAEATRSEAPDEPHAGASLRSHADWLDGRAEQIEREARG